MAGNSGDARRGMAIRADFTPLSWNDGRWHVGERGIHAGDSMELMGDHLTFFPVRIESSNSGAVLYAIYRVHGIEFTYKIDPAFDRLRF